MSSCGRGRQRDLTRAGIFPRKYENERAGVVAEGVGLMSGQVRRERTREVGEGW